MRLAAPRTRAPTAAATPGARGEPRAVVGLPVVARGEPRVVVRLPVAAGGQPLVAMPRADALRVTASAGLPVVPMVVARAGLRAVPTAARAGVGVVAHGELLVVALGRLIVPAPPGSAVPARMRVVPGAAVGLPAGVSAALRRTVGVAGGMPHAVTSARAGATIPARAGRRSRPRQDMTRGRGTSVTPQARPVARSGPGPVVQLRPVRPRSIGTARRRGRRPRTTSIARVSPASWGGRTRARAR